MSWFGGKGGPILRHSSSTVILAAEVEGSAGARALTRLLYTGHDGSHGAVRAFAPATGGLWEAKFADENDVQKGMLVLVGDVLVTHDPSAGALVGHEKWTGKQRWKTPIGKLVSRLGVERTGDAVIGITIDHVVHGISASTGEDRSRGRVMTDEEARSTIDATHSGTSVSWQSGRDHRGKVEGWSSVHELFADLHVLERHWAGTTTWGIGTVKGNAVSGLIEAGAGRFEGMIQVDGLAVLGFELRAEGESEERYHWYVFAREPLELLAVLRADAPSEMFRSGHSVWKGKL